MQKLSILRLSIMGEAFQSCFLRRLIYSGLQMEFKNQVTQNAFDDIWGDKVIQGRKQQVWT